MKYVLLSVLLLCANFSTCQTFSKAIALNNSDGHIYFANEKSQWHHCLVIDGHEPWTVDIQTEVVDTFVIDDIPYSLISGNFFGHSILPKTDSIYVFNLEEKVYYLEGDSIHVLYDFDVNVGDTLTHKFPVKFDSLWFSENPTVSPYYKLVIDSITTIDINGESLKRVYFSEFNELDEETNYIWTPTDLGRWYTEKLGYENFILPYIVTGFDENNTGCDLREFSDNQINFINTDAYCFTTSTVNPIKENQISLFPNPSNNLIEIKTGEKFDLIFIYNSQGEIVNKLAFNHIISVSNFDNGIYFLTLLSSKNNRIESLKFCIKR